MASVAGMSDRQTGLRFGTRGSALALAQTGRVIESLRQRAPDVAAEPVVIRTEGDADKITPLTILGGRGVFTSALQMALLEGRVDAAVHSAKDLPTEQPAGLELIAFPEREDPRDVIVSRHGVPLSELPPNPTIGTSSRRRMAQIKRLRPDARIVDVRGNIDTRLRRALNDELDAIVLAAAGVTRMGWQDRITQYLPVEEFVPSPGQGALAVESRLDDEAARPLLTLLNDPAIADAVRMERAFLRAVGGGCTKPIAAHVVADGDGWRLYGMIASDDQERIAYADEPLDAADPLAHAAAVAERLLREVTPGSDAAPGNKAATAGTNGAPSPAQALPLAGLRVLVTRPEAQADSLVTALREQGAEPVAAPTIRIEDIGPSAPLERALNALLVGDYDWVVFTSVNAVERVLQRLRERGQTWPIGRAARVVAVGKITAAKLADAGVKVDLVPESADAEGVVSIMARQYITGQRIFYPKGDQARRVITTGLRRSGATVDAVDVYRTVPETRLDPAVRDQIMRGEVDVVTFASPSAVRGLISLLGSITPLDRMTVICVGQVTAAAARSHGLPVHGVAPDPSAAGIVEAVIAWRRSPAAALRDNPGDLATDLAGDISGETHSGPGRDE